MAELLLAVIERLDPTASGALVVADACSVFVERGQVCWAAATGLEKRLRELMRAQPMRDAIKEHTIESLLALPEGEAIEWVPHRNDGYLPKFTFSPLELLVEINTRLYAREADGAARGLAFLDDGIVAASYVTGDDGEALPVRVTAPDAPLAMIAELGTWVTAAFEATARGFSTAMMANALATATGEVVLGWRTSQRQHHIAVVDPAQLARTTTDLEQRSYPAVLSLMATRKWGEIWPTRKRLCRS